MKKLIFIFSIVTNLLLGQSSSCNISSVIPSRIYYAGIQTTPVYTGYTISFLCTNAIVYDTINIGDIGLIISSGATYIWNSGGTGASIIYIKNGGTLNLKSNGYGSAMTVYLEPGASIIDPSNFMAISGPTISCSLITLPPVNCFTGINEINKNSIASKIYPNPSNGSFKLKIDSEIEKGEIILMNSLGQKVHEQKILTGENQINTNSLAKGLYHYLLLENKKQIGNGKIAIE